jgi:putative heme-binding domain-containing protein
MKRIWLLELAVAAMCAAQTPRINPFANDPNAIGDARAMFSLRCAPCHGRDAAGARAPDLTLGTYSVGDADEDLFNVISDGAAGTEMPDFGNRIGSDNVWRLVTYIRSISKKDIMQLKANAENGKTLFAGKGQCTQCHAISGIGGRMGPDLTSIGRQRSLKYLRESMTDPNADLTPGYNTITVVTKDGKKIVGVQRNFDTFSAQLIDLAGNYYSFLTNDVVSINREHKSMMPNYTNTFNDSEMDDILAYLVTLRGETKR